MISSAEATSSPVVASLFDHLLGAIHDGTLQPGARISDAELAREYNVSRTPAREAIQRLRDIGVIEASANRYTRVAVVTPLQTTQAMAVWVGLYGVLAREVAHDVPDEVIETMNADHHRFVELLASGDYPGIASANFDFYGRLRPLSRNEVLQRSITGVVHMIRLGSLHLPESLDMPQLAGNQHQLLEALRASDVERAVASIESLRSIRIPQE